MFNLVKRVTKHLDFHIYPSVAVVFIFAILTVPFTLYLPESYGYENAFLEDLQLGVLCCAFTLATKAKWNKKFFIFAALIITIIALREVNCGRTLFFPRPGVENAFLSWKEIPYGYLAHPIYGLYMILAGVYFIVNKCYITIWEYIKRVPFPFWNMLFLAIGAILGTIGEHTGQMLLEESFELLFYVSLTGLIDLYGYHNNFKIPED